MVVLPDRLRGLGLEQAFRSVNYSISDMMYMQHGHEEQFRDQLKKDLARMIGESLLPDITFTQIREPDSESINVKGRVIVLAEDQFRQLISFAR